MKDIQKSEVQGQEPQWDAKKAQKEAKRFFRRHGHYYSLAAFDPTGRMLTVSETREIDSNLKAGERTSYTVLPLIPGDNDMDGAFPTDSFTMKSS